MESIANDGKTRLVFEARVTGAKPVLAKTDQHGSGSNGRLELTLTLDQPKAPIAPRRPTPGYGFDKGGLMTPRPADIARKKNEPDEEYTARDAVVKRLQEQAMWDLEYTHFARRMAEYEIALQSHQAVAVAHAARTMGYAQLVGICSVFGNMAMRVELTPLAQDMLPGFSVGLLPEPVEGE